LELYPALKKAGELEPDEHPELVAQRFATRVGRENVSWPEPTRLRRPHGVIEKSHAQIDNNRCASRGSSTTPSGPALPDLDDPALTQRVEVADREVRIMGSKGDLLNLKGSAFSQQPYPSRT
jgi:hypothetical protein